jgi:hypothetical protein
MKFTLALVSALCSINFILADSGKNVEAESNKQQKRGIYSGAIAGGIVGEGFAGGIAGEGLPAFASAAPTETGSVSGVSTNTNTFTTIRQAVPVASPVAVPVPQ